MRRRAYDGLEGRQKARCHDDDKEECSAVGVEEEEVKGLVVHEAHAVVDPGA